MIEMQTAFWFVGFGGCFPARQFPRNTDIRSSVEEFQNVKESQGSQKKVSALAYIWKPVIL